MSRRKHREFLREKQWQKCYHSCIICICAVKFHRHISEANLFTENASFIQTKVRFSYEQSVEKLKSNLKIETKSIQPLSLLHSSNSYYSVFQCCQKSVSNQPATSIVTTNRIRAVVVAQTSMLFSNSSIFSTSISLLSFVYAR